MALQDSQVGLTTDLVRELKAEAKRDWAEAGHRRWTILKEHLVSTNLIAAIKVSAFVCNGLIFLSRNPLGR